MQLQAVGVEKVLQCKDCSYDISNRLIKECGLCEEKAIAERIKWWQEGKTKLKQREENK
tara:strand:+ start:76 stop:252 length:177 start_codon:yes stop_codon:yes gene_type:complete